MNLSACEIVVPHQFLTLAREMHRVIDRLRDGFVNRPAPGGSPCADLVEVLDGNWEHLARSPGKITAVVNRLGEQLLRADVTDSEVCLAVADVDREVATLVSAYHDLWRTTFPSGLEQGQILTAAVYERLMRTLLDGFEQMVVSMEKPEEAIARYGSTTINLQIVLNCDAETERFTAWLNSMRNNSARACAPFSGLGTLAASFALGWWFGKDK